MTLTNVARVAVARLVEKGNALTVKRLFNDAERQVIANTIAATNATAELLGRARVRERAYQAIRTHDPERFAELPPHVEVFDEPNPRQLKPMPPARALAYFKRLVPTLGVKTPERFGQSLERAAFTLSADVDAIILEKVKEAIAAALETGREIRQTPGVIEGLLTEAGVSPRNPQYAEMVFRTNMQDAYTTGSVQEMQDSDVADVFPVWKYLAVKDHRTRPEHAQHNERYFPNDVSFAEVRDSVKGEFSGYNCRCSFAPVDKWTWKELQGKGATVSTFAETFAAGAPCKPGETAARTGCIPAGKAKSTTTTSVKSKPTVRDIQDRVRGMLANGKTPSAKEIKGFATDLGAMTVKDLGELKKQLGVKASGAKAVLVQKITDRALGNKGPGSVAKLPSKAPEPVQLPPSPRATSTATTRPKSTVSSPSEAEFGRLATSFPREARPSLSAKEADAVRRYTAGAHRGINEPLWSGQSLSPEAARIESGLQDTFAKVPRFSKPVIVRRGVNMTRRDLQSTQALTPGQEITFPAYTSTTNKAGTFRGNVEYRIAANRGLDVRGIGDADTQKERELLLPRDSKFRVEAVKRVGRRTQVHLTQL